MGPTGPTQAQLDQQKKAELANIASVQDSLAARTEGYSRRFGVGRSLVGGKSAGGAIPLASSLFTNRKARV